MATDTALFNKFGNTIPPGAIIFKEGDEGEKMYIIQKGKVRVSKTINNTEHTLAILDKGDFFGETALVTKSARTATITAVTEVELLAFDRNDFTGMIEKNAKIALNIIDKLCRRLQSANLQILHFVKKNEKGLIALNLLYRFKEEGMEEARLSCQQMVNEIALALELPPENVKKTLGDFEKSHFIEMSGDELILKDKHKLEKAAG